MPSLDEKLKLLPDRPGVYLFRDGAGTILYVGKAVSLRNRVRSYFQAGRGLEAKVQAMVAQIADLEHIVTDSEVEALILESNLIKENRPKYNIRLRDDKQYPYLRVDPHAPWPRLELVRHMRADGARYFGPFPHSGAVWETMQILRRVFPYRSCSDRRLAQGHACLYHHIHRCLAPCVAACTPEEYRAMIGELVQFLEGRGDAVLRRLEERMQAAAGDLRFEEAAELRDRLAALRQVLEKQKITSPRLADRDLVALARGRDETAVQVFFVREGHLAGRDAFMLSGTQGRDDAEVLAAFLKQYYADGPVVPREIVLPVSLGGAGDAESHGRGYGATGVVAVEGGAPPAVRVGPAAEAAASTPAGGGADEPPAGAAGAAGAGEAEQGAGCDERERAGDAAAIWAWLAARRGGPVRLVVPRRGETRRLLEMVRENAAQYLAEQQWHRERSREAADAALAELQAALGLGSPPQRIECYDISNTQGTNSVGAMTVFEHGVPKKADYRRFRIRTVAGADDFASLREVLGRRFRRARELRAQAAPAGGDVAALPPGGFAALPDLIIIDGGKGQLGAGRQVLAELDLAWIPTFGLAKENEWLFAPGRGEPIVLARTSPALHLLQHLRDETHRFAITYHRSLRGRTGIGSVLEQVPGIGPRRRKALLDAYRSLAALRAADPEELARVPGMTRAVAEELSAYLQTV